MTASRITGSVMSLIKGCEKPGIFSVKIDILLLVGIVNRILEEFRCSRHMETPIACITLVAKFAKVFRVVQPNIHDSWNA